jgi:hypothetical protein
MTILLLDITFKTGELIQMILWVFGIIGTFVCAIGLFVKILHDQMIKRLEVLDTDLKPLVVQVALHGEHLSVHDEQILQLKAKDDEQDKWLSHYDSRIQTIEKVVHQHK